MIILKYQEVIIKKYVKMKKILVLLTLVLLVGCKIQQPMTWNQELVDSKVIRVDRKCKVVNKIVYNKYTRHYTHFIKVNGMNTQRTVEYPFMEVNLQEINETKRFLLKERYYISPKDRVTIYEDLFY
jgi:hypothetical protein